MSLGGQTVGIVGKTRDGSDRNRFNSPAESHSVTYVGGVLMRPARASEKVELNEVATGVWFCTAPPVAAVLAAKPTAELLYDGTTAPADVSASKYQITGVEPMYASSGKVHHVVITCQRQEL